MQPISKSKLSRYTGLKQKKYRNQLNLYSISGLNAVETAIQSKTIHIETLLIQQDQTVLARQLIENIENRKQIPVYELTQREFKQLSDERNPQGIAVIAQKQDTTFNETELNKDTFIYLDCINDPGNLGTIIRTAAWFGITQILLSPNSVDPFQPKTIRASAGLISHIQIYENVQISSLKSLKLESGYKFIGATAYGQQSLNTFKFNPSEYYGLIFGSEAHGISEQINQILDEEVSIPASGIGESLNLAASTAIFLNSYRQQIKLKAAIK